MSTLLNFINSTRKRGLFWWLSYFWNELLNNIYERKVSNKVDNNWKGIKISKTIVPEGWTKENAFSYLEKEYKGMNFKRFKD